jgi:hypothetical protein
LEAEVRLGQEWRNKGVTCRAREGKEWSDDDERQSYAGHVHSITYIVPDTTPFDIPNTLTDYHIENEDRFVRPSSDLTKREWFAGMAMQGLLANLSSLRDGGFRDEEVATFSSQMADALIAALNQKEETK